MRNNDTMQSLTINPSKTAILACTYEFFPRQTLSENTTSFFFLSSFQKVHPTTVICTVGFTAFLGLLMCKRAAAMHSNQNSFSVT